MNFTLLQNTTDSTSSLDPQVLLGITIGLTSLACLYRYARPTNDWNKLPGPPCIPIIGSYQMFSYMKRFALHQFWLDMAQSFGPISKIKLGRAYALHSQMYS